MFTPTHGIVDECEVDEAEERRIEFLEARDDEPEALEPPEQTLDLVAPLTHMAAYFSAYEISPGMVDSVEALAIRAFANDLFNTRMEASKS